MESTVLIVDDDPATVEFLKTVISQSPRVPRYRVTTANSGFRAEQACRTQQPAVVLLDLMLPDADGIDVLRALKAIDQGLEVIVISGQGTIKRALEAGQAGAFYFLEKSDLDPKGLLGLLDRAADLVRRAPAAPVAAGAAAGAATRSRTSSARARRCWRSSSWSRPWRRATPTC